MNVNFDQVVAVLAIAISFGIIGGVLIGFIANDKD